MIAGLKGWISSLSKWVSVAVDSSTHSLITMLYGHHEIHGGSSYTCSDVQNVDTTTLKWMVAVANTDKEPNLIFDIECTGEMTLLITEGADRAGGTAVAAINRNRRSTNTAETTITRTPAGGSTDGATTIKNLRTGATGVASKTIAAGGARGQNEFILKKNTKYIISVTTYADVWVSLNLDWYEHTPKN